MALTVRRRSLLRVGGLTAFGAATGVAGFALRGTDTARPGWDVRHPVADNAGWTGQTAPVTPPRHTPAAALRRLVDGNARFATGQPSRPHQDPNRRGQLTDGQDPFAVVVGCADSRVPAEIVFDQGLGDLFVCRTAGHVIDRAVLGSIEYAVEHLHTPLVMVLGHESCGAVKAAVDTLHGRYDPPGNVKALVERVLPAVITAERTGRNVLSEAVAENVRQSVTLVGEQSRLIAAAAAAGQCRVVGAVYDLDRGLATLV